ncbi:MAG TPA: hypothetical protein VFG10_17875 [Saprospiraceae bacterium]|nr:hypothetical protein [Saprospiraceae bacterium]
MSTKEALHRLIDTITDENILRGYLELIHRLSRHQEAELWNKLSEEEKEELLLSYDESFFKENLISNEEVRQHHSKWLGK